MTVDYRFLLEEEIEALKRAVKDPRIGPDWKDKARARIEDLERQLGVRR